MQSDIGFLDGFETRQLSREEEEDLDIRVDLAIFNAESKSAQVQAPQPEESPPQVFQQPQ